MTDAGVLVVGYGNPLRGDDGIGWHAVRLLADDPRLAGARVLACHQLAPELAEDVSQASLVVLVDASVDGAPGSVAVRSIQPRQDSPLSWSHHLDPAALAGLAHALYDHVPPTAWPALPSPTATGSHPPSSGCSPRSSTGSPEWWKSTPMDEPTPHLAGSTVCSCLGHQFETEGVDGFATSYPKVSDIQARLPRPADDGTRRGNCDKAG